jgi:hypothetical protein
LPLAPCRLELALLAAWATVKTVPTETYRAVVVTAQGAADVVRITITDAQHSMHTAAEEARQVAARHSRAAELDEDRPIPDVSAPPASLELPHMQQKDLADGTIGMSSVTDGVLALLYASCYGSEPRCHTQRLPL